MYTKTLFKHPSTTKKKFFGLLMLSIFVTTPIFGYKAFGLVPVGVSLSDFDLLVDILIPLGLLINISLLFYGNYVYERLSLHMFFGPPSIIMVFFFAIGIGSFWLLPMESVTSFRGIFYTSLDYIELFVKLIVDISLRIVFTVPVAIYLYVLGYLFEPLNISS